MCEKLLSEFVSFIMSKLLLLLNYQSDDQQTFVSSPGLLLVAH